MQLYAGENLATLRLDRADVLAFWEWSAAYANGSIFPLPDPHPDDLVPLQERPAEQQEAFAQVYGRVLNRACRDLTFVFGVGLRVLAGGEWYPDVQPPPPLEGAYLPPEWGAADDLAGSLAAYSMQLASRPMTGPGS